MSFEVKQINLKGTPLKAFLTVPKELSQLERKILQEEWLELWAGDPFSRPKLVVLPTGSQLTFEVDNDEAH